MCFSFLLIHSRQLGVGNLNSDMVVAAGHVVNLVRPLQRLPNAARQTHVVQNTRRKNQQTDITSNLLDFVLVAQCQTLDERLARARGTLIHQLLNRQRQRVKVVGQRQKVARVHRLGQRNHLFEK